MKLLIDDFGEPRNYCFVGNVAGVKIYGHNVTEQEYSTTRYPTGGVSVGASANQVYRETLNNTAASPQRIML